MKVLDSALEAVQIPSLEGGATVLIVIEMGLQLLHGMEEFQARWTGWVITQSAQMRNFVVTFECMSFFTSSASASKSTLHAAKRARLSYFSEVL